MLVGMGTSVMVIEDRPAERAKLVAALAGLDVHTAGDWVDVATTVNGGQWTPDAVVIGRTPGLRTDLLVSVLRKVYGPGLRVVLYTGAGGVVGSKLADEAGADTWVTDDELDQLADVVSWR